MSRLITWILKVIKGFVGAIRIRTESPDPPSNNEYSAGIVIRREGGIYYYGEASIHAPGPSWVP